MPSGDRPAIACFACLASRIGLFELEGVWVDDEIGIFVQWKLIGEVEPLLIDLMLGGLANMREGKVF